MTKQDEAMKLAIEVFGGGDWHDEIVDTDWADKANNAITALREALAEQPAVWSLNVDELAIYRDGKRFVELDEGNNNDSWREALRAGSEVVRLLNAANGIKGAA